MTVLVDDQWDDMTSEDAEVRLVSRGGIDFGFNKRTGAYSLKDLNWDVLDVIDWHRSLRGFPGAPLRALPGGKARKPPVRSKPKR